MATVLQVRPACARCHYGLCGERGHSRMITIGHVDLGGDHGVVRLAVCEACGACWVRQEDEVIYWWLRVVPPE